MTPITIAVLGGGTVGASVVRQLRENGDDLAARIGAPVEVTAVAVRDPDRVRPHIPADVITADADAVARSGADIVIEVMGGIEPARTYILAAMAAGSSVVTANKALLAEDGAALFEAAERAGVDLFFEASVAGAIPLLRPLRESLAGDQITRVLGIVNGTTNYILSRMADDGVSYHDALAEAQSLGYAEADPTADVSGDDAAAKAAILAEIAFHTPVTRQDVWCEGITEITQADMVAAAEMGFVVKLLAIAERIEHGVVVRVHPAMLPVEHPLASVRGAFNAVFVEAKAAGEVMFYGRGAGGEPTASAVLGDLVVAARNRLLGGRGPGQSVYTRLPVRSIDVAQTSYYVNLDVTDRPGVLASIASAFADQGVSIQVVRQDGHGDDAGLILRTHRAADAALRATVAELRDLPTVREVVGTMRVEG